MLKDMEIMTICNQKMQAYKMHVEKSLWLYVN